MARRVLSSVATMDTEEIIQRVEEIEQLVRERRYEIALGLTLRLEADMAAVPGDTSVTQPVRDLVAASRLFTESLITLQTLRHH